MGVDIQHLYRVWIIGLNMLGCCRDGKVSEARLFTSTDMQTFGCGDTMATFCLSSGAASRPASVSNFFLPRVDEVALRNSQAGFVCTSCCLVCAMTINFCNQLPVLNWNLVSKALRFWMFVGVSTGSDVKWN